jgi:hypothetical protein
VKVEYDEQSEHIDGYDELITENPYREEINSFLKRLEDSSYVPAWDFEKDKEVLNWIDKIESDESL